MVVGKNGITEKTADNILLGAGTIHKNLKYNSMDSTWNFDTSIIGATNGGSKITITPDIKQIDVDGAAVAIKGLKVKTGEKAILEVNFVELTKEIIKYSTLGKDGVSEDSNFDLIESKPSIETGDYLDNIAFVGVTAKGKKIIYIQDNSLCTSGLDMQSKNSDSATNKYTFECHADGKGNYDTLPWHIYYPKDTE